MSLFTSPPTKSFNMFNFGLQVRSSLDVTYGRILDLKTVLTVWMPHYKLQLISYKFSVLTLFSFCLCAWCVCVFICVCDNGNKEIEIRDTLLTVTSQGVSQITWPTMQGVSQITWPTMGSCGCLVTVSVCNESKPCGFLRGCGFYEDNPIDFKVR